MRRLEPEQLVCVTASNLEAVCFADSSVIEPVRRNPHIFESIVNRVQNAVGADLKQCFIESTMDLQLKGKRALVTGSTAGIGLAIAQGLAKEGAALILYGRSTKHLTKLLLLSIKRELRGRFQASGVPTSM